MFKKMNYKLKNLRLRWRSKGWRPKEELNPERELFNKTEMLEMYNKGIAVGHKLGYAEGKDDGINIAKNAATNQLKEIIWQQNKNKPNQFTVPQVPSPPQRW